MFVYVFYTVKLVYFDLDLAKSRMKRNFVQSPANSSQILENIKVITNSTLTNLRI